MRIARCYRFEAAPEAVWSAMSDVRQFRQWWPWLRRFRGVGLVTGDHWECEIRPPAPYLLHFVVTLREVCGPTLVVADITGDVEGEARLELVGHGGSCELRLTSELVPVRRALRVMAGVAWPLARWGHTHVLDTGARQFAGWALATTAKRGAVPSTRSGRGRS